MTRLLRAIAETTESKPLLIGGLQIPCAVLEDGTRVLTQQGVRQALGRGAGKTGSGDLPSFLNPNNLQPFVDADLMNLVKNPIHYVPKVGRGRANGVPAILLPRICEVWLKARDAGVLTSTQKKTAEQADILMRGFAHVGVIALVDEATGYKKQKDAYQKILEQYIATELRPWVMTFDENYYKQLYRLLGWDWDAFKNNKKTHPQYIGKLTNRLVYEKLAPGVLEELKKLNPKNKKGNRKNRFHQHLSESHGYRELLKLVSAVTILMEQFDDGDIAGATQKIDARFPTLMPVYQTTMDFPVAKKEEFEKIVKRASKPA